MKAMSLAWIKMLVAYIIGVPLLIALFLLAEALLKAELPMVILGLLCDCVIFWSATQKFKILLRRDDILTEEDKKNPNAPIFWMMMVAEYFMFAVILIGIL